MRYLNILYGNENPKLITVKIARNQKANDIFEGIVESLSSKKDMFVASHDVGEHILLSLKDMLFVTLLNTKLTHKIFLKLFFGFIWKYFKLSEGY